MDMVWSQHVGSWQMPRWMTTSVTPLFSLYLFFDVSLKIWKFENFWPTCKVAVWHFLSLTSYRTSCSGFVCHWKVYLSELGFDIVEENFCPRNEKSWKCGLLNPSFTSPRFRCSRSSSGIGLGASVNAQWRTDLPAGSWTCPRTAWRWSRSWWSSHCWGWETGAGSHSLPWWTSPNCSSRDSQYNRTTQGLRRRLRLEWYIW